MAAVASNPQMRPIDFPALYIATDRAAVVAQRSYIRLVQADLWLLLMAAALTAVKSLAGDPVPALLRRAPVLGAGLPPRVGDLDWVYWCAGLCLVATLVVKSANRILRFDHEWFDGRAAAESVKTATWRYMMRVPPFDADETAADTAFIDRLRAILDIHRDLNPGLSALPPDAQQISPVMRQMRARALGERKDCYLHQRVVEQVDWYREKSESNRRAGIRWFWVDMLARGTAVACAILVIIQPQALNAIAMFTAVAAAATAWVQLGRHTDVGKSYGAAAQELLMLRSSFDSADDEQRFGQLVTATEEAIMREHTMWLTKRT